MKKLYLVFLALVLLFLPATNAVAVYQLDQPIKDLDNYTLREVFENRNTAMPDLTGKTEISAGVYRLYDVNGITIDYEINNGIYNFNGTVMYGDNIYIFSNIEQSIEYTISYIAVSGSLTGGSMALGILYPYYRAIRQETNTNLDMKDTFITTTQDIFVYYSAAGRTFDNYKFKLQLEKGDTVTPYQVPTNGPYSNLDVGEFNLTPEQIEMYYDLYLEAVRFENENIEAGKDPGGYQNIFKSIINGVKGLIESMGGLWQWLNAPIITSDMSDYSFNIDWSWDLIGVIRQLMNSIGVLFLQVAFVVPNLAFTFMGIPIRISILSLLFSNMIFLILGWIIVKSFVI